ncbi:MAG: hypothetical protein ACE3JK_10770 [Sporolactobacillus sp.]
MGSLIGWLRNNGWFWLFVVYAIATILQYAEQGWHFVLTASGIGLIIALLTTVFSNLRALVRIYRRIKYYFGPSIFKWTASADFDVRVNKFTTIAVEEKNLVTLFKKALEKNGLPINEFGSPAPSRDKFGNLIIFTKEYYMNTVISLTDNGEEDNEGYSLYEINFKTYAALRYRDKNKAINGILLELYKLFEKKYFPSTEKYSIHLELENVPDDFWKKQFVREFLPSEVSNFSIRTNLTRSVQEASNKGISLTTDRREELYSAINDLILRIS